MAFYDPLTQLPNRRLLNDRLSQAINNSKRCGNYGALSEPYQLTIHEQGQPDALAEHHCTVSIGVTMFNNAEAVHNDIFKRADKAMYEAKEAGRNSIRFYQ